MMFLSNAFYGVILIAAAISFIISLIYKIVIDEKEAEKVKEKMNKLKEKQQEATKKGNQEEAKKHMNEMMKHSSKQMKMQLKPMAITFVLIIPLFYFVFPTLYDVTIDPTQEQFTFDGIEKEISVENNDTLMVMIDGDEYTKNEVIPINGYNFQISSYNSEQNQLKLSQVAVVLPFSLPFIGNTLGWLGWYILLAIIFGQIFRKAMGVM